MSSTLPALATASWPIEQVNAWPVQQQASVALQRWRLPSWAILEPKRESEPDWGMECALPWLALSVEASLGER